MAESIADPGPARRGLDPGRRCTPRRSIATAQLALLDRAAAPGRADRRPADRLLRMGDAAERLYELGEVEKARTVFAEGLLHREVDDGQDGAPAGVLRRPARAGRPGRGPGHRR